MKLIELSANKSSFKTIRFNPKGLTLILGDRSKDEDEGSGNGVGKTLAMGLLHYCLGANTPPIFKKSLSDWVFYLHFLINGKEYVVERSADGKHLSLNNKKISLPQYREWLNESSAFRLDKQLSNLSFRSLFIRFARLYPEDCIAPVKTHKEPDFDSQLRTLYLLSLDCTLIINKYNYKKRKDELEDANKIWHKERILHEVLRKGTDPKIHAEWLFQEIPRLQEELARFEIAENYHAILAEADDKTKQLRNFDKQIAVRKFQLEGIEKLLKQPTDISHEDLMNFYKGLQSVFKPEILSHFEAVERFHNDLITNRKSRLETDKRQIVHEIRQIEADRKQLGQKRDKLLQTLHGKRALDEYTALSKRLADLQSEYEIISEYLNFSTRLNHEIQEIKENMLIDDRSTTDYVQKKPLEKYNLAFQRLANRLYPHIPAGILLDNNTGNNQIRYNFNIQIQGDDSDAINSARILCFDWLIFMIGANHTMNFLWHDSRLFAQMGVPPRAEWFKHVIESISGTEKQYIASLNIENYDSMKEYLSNEQQDILEQAVKLILRDDKPEHKLLGIQFGSMESDKKQHILW